MASKIEINTTGQGTTKVTIREGRSVVAVFYAGTVEAAAEAITQQRNLATEYVAAQAEDDADEEPAGS